MGACMGFHYFHSSAGATAHHPTVRREAMSQQPQLGTRLTLPVNEYQAEILGGDQVVYDRVAPDENTSRVPPQPDSSYDAQQPSHSFDDQITSTITFKPQESDPMNEDVYANDNIYDEMNQTPLTSNPPPVQYQQQQEQYEHMQYDPSRHD